MGSAGTPIEEGEMASEEEERAASEEWCRLWTAMSVRRLVRRREESEEGRAAVDEGLEAVRARFFGASMLQAAESPPDTPLTSGAMRQAEARAAPDTPLTPLGDLGDLWAAMGTGASDDSGGRPMLLQEQQEIDGVDREARACGGLRRRRSVSPWYMLTK